MHLNRKTLLTALYSLKTVAPRKAPQPILSRVLIAERGTEIHLVATDLDTCITYSLEGGESKGGLAVLPLANLYAYVKGLDEPTVELTETDPVARTWEAKTPRTSATFLGMDPAEFPEWRPGSQTTNLTMDLYTFRVALSRTVPFTSNDVSRYVLTGVNFRQKEGFLHLAATDGKMLATDSLVSGSQELFDVTLPKPALVGFGLATKGSYGAVDLAIGAWPESTTPAWARITAGPVTVMTRLMEGNYPCYRNAIWDDRSYAALINSKVLSKAVKNAQADVDGDGVTDWLFNGKTLTIRGRTSSQEVPLNRFAGFEDMGIKLNPVYMEIILGCVQGKEAAIMIKSPAHPILAKEGRWTALAMPLVLNSKT